MRVHYRIVVLFLTSSSLPSANEVVFHNVFTSVCQGFCPVGRGCIPACTGADTPQGSGRYVSYWNAFLLGNRNSRFEYLYASVYKFCVNFDAGSVLSKMFGIIWAGIQGKREAVYSLPSFLDYAKVSAVRQIYSLPSFLNYVKVSTVR